MAVFTDFDFCCLTKVNDVSVNDPAIAITIIAMTVPVIFFIVSYLSL